MKSPRHGVDAPRTGLDQQEEKTFPWPAPRMPHRGGVVNFIVGRDAAYLRAVNACFGRTTLAADTAARDAVNWRVFGRERGHGSGTVAATRARPAAGSRANVIAGGVRSKRQRLKTSPPARARVIRMRKIKDFCAHGRGVTSGCIQHGVRR